MADQENISTDWPFTGLERNHYGVIICDPPWTFKTYSQKGWAKSPMAQYNCLDLDGIKRLPIQDLAKADCALLLWATAPMLPQAIEVMEAWGFTFKSAGAWAKRSKTGTKWAFGTGYIFRSATEFFLLGTIGKPQTFVKDVRNLIVSPIREHSRKPDDQYSIMEELFDGPYVEIFSTSNREGWDTWGFEKGIFDENV